MNFWKALLLVSFLVYAAHSEEVMEEIKDAVAYEPKIEDTPQENDEVSAFDEDEQLEDEDENDVEEQDQEQDPTHKKLVSKKRIFVFRNKNVGQCKNAKQTVRCFHRSRCVKRHSYYKNRCVKYLVSRFCVIQQTTTCQFCTKSVVKSCFRIKQGHKYVTQCSNSNPIKSCTRRITKRVNKTVLVRKFFAAKKY